MTIKVQDAQRLLTSVQAGALLKHSARTVQRMAARGELPVAGKLPGPNGAYLFDADQIEARAAEQAVAS